MIKIKRIYSTYSEDDGYRVLVDRLWPRGMTKERARVDLWLKDIAPSNDLRKWYAHDLDKWIGFKKQSLSELEQNQDLVNQLMDVIKSHKMITLLFASKDVEHNEAFVLKEYLKKHKKQSIK